MAEGRRVGRLPADTVGRPMRDIGLVGVPFSGKSTLFTALTRAGSHGGQANVAVVPVPDPRLPVLTEMERSKKTVARPGSLRRRPGRRLERPGSGEAPRGRRAGGRPPVLRRRRGPGAGARRGARRAAARRPRRRRERAREGREEGRGKPAVPRSTRCSEPRTRWTPRRPLRDAGLSERGVADTSRAIAPLTLKPEVVIANLEEGDGAARRARRRGGGLRVDRGRDRRDGPRGGPRAPRGVRRDRTRAGARDRGRLRALDLITFLTTGDDETRAWEVRRGATAPEAAGAIHTDLQRGFIRAEVICYDELVAAGSMDAAKAAGKVRVEGKDYVVARGRHPARPLRRVGVRRRRSPTRDTRDRSTSGTRRSRNHGPISDNLPWFAHGLSTVF